MATITFEFGDTFMFPDGSGVVLLNSEALIITGQGGRTGYQVTLGPIPPDAVPGKSTVSEVKLALEAVVRAVTPRL